MEGHLNVYHHGVFSLISHEDFQVGLQLLELFLEQQIQPFKKKLNLINYSKIK